MMKVIVIIALIAAVVVIFALKQDKPETAPISEFPVVKVSVADANVITEIESQPVKKMPKLVDLGAGKCQACKMMTPILEDLKDNYSNSLVVEYYDVWQQPEHGKRYGIKLIPTQIFEDADGGELFRHQGFISKEDIINKWQELGFEITANN